MNVFNSWQTHERILSRSINHFLTWEGATAAAIAGYIAAGAAVVSAGVGAYSAYASGENAKETADYNAKVQENAALDAQQRGAVAAAEHQQKVRRMIATQAATASANGVMANTGTPLDMIVDTAGMGKLDALRLLNNAGRESSGYRGQSDLLKIQGENSQLAGQLNAGASILGGAASAANSINKFKNPATYGSTQSFSSNMFTDGKF
jgi:hypothetical protein